MLTGFLERLLPHSAARQHFDAARVEILKGLRAVLDARIEQISKAKAEARGTKIPVE
jgi:hypothetical protein